MLWKYLFHNITDSQSSSFMALKHIFDDYRVKDGEGVYVGGFALG